MFKQICFFRKHPDMSMEEFIDYYENEHARLAQRSGTPSVLPKAKRYVRRYVTPEPNPVTGEVIDSGYDCIMELWWESREDFDAARAIINDPGKLAATLEDEAKLFATHSYPVCTVVEYETELGPPAPLNSS